MTKRPTGHIEYIEDHSISYSASGLNPPRPWISFVDGKRVNSDKTYAWAAIHLANDLAWRHPRVQALREQADVLEREIIEQELEKLTLKRPDQDNDDPELGRIQVYQNAAWSCGVCYIHGDHESIWIANAHGCNR